jgi:D-alanine transaminase
MTLPVGNFPQMPTVNWNGQLMPANQTPLGTYHPVAFFGDSVYDAVFAPNGRPFRLDAHLDRLLNSGAAAGFDGPSRDQWKQMVHDMLVAFRKDVGGEKDVVVYMQMAPAALPFDEFGSVNERDMVRPKGWSVDAWTQPLGAWLSPTPALLATGIKLATVDERRHDTLTTKTTSLYAAKDAKREALAKGGDDALIIGRNGMVKENSASNTHMVFTRPDGSPVVVTPEQGGMLEGIRIPIMQELCADAGIAYERRDVTPEEARQAGELLVTSATRGIIPATTLDGQPVGTGRPGPVFTQLRAGYDELLRQVRAQPYGVAGMH